MNSTKSIITRLLSNLGTSREVEQYLKHYSNVEAEKFAVIKVGGGTIKDDLDNLASALSFLRQVGLFPIVIHGAGPQLDQALEAEGVRSEKIEGLRVTTPEVLETARRVFHSVSLQLVDALEALGTRARPISTGVFEAEFVDQATLGFVGEVRKVHLDLIESSIRAGHLPIIACLGETPGGQILNINADVAASELAVAVQPHKIIFLTPTGGLLDDRNRIIAAVNLREDFDELMSKPWVHSGMRVKLREVAQLLDKLPPTTSVSITSPEHLAKELFTHQGSGTLIRMGERVRSYSSFAEVDQGRMRALLETCFGRKLTDDYFESKQVDRIYLTDSYCATAILTHGGPPTKSTGSGPSTTGQGASRFSSGVPYLDKFAVTQEAQGQGLGASLWGRMKREVPQLFWRSRTGNPINTWYFTQSGGCFRGEKWAVFWYGLDSYDLIRDCVECALAMPATFLDQPAEVLAGSV